MPGVVPGIWCHAMNLPGLSESNVKMNLHSALASVEQAEAAAEQFATQAGFDDDLSSHIAMVVREAAVNAAKHGNLWNAEKRVEVEFDLTDKALTIRVADEGDGLDPHDVPDCLEPENLLRTSGRGIFLMRSIMDEVHFRKLTPGTEITMVKRRIEKETEA